MALGEHGNDPLTPDRLVRELVRDIRIEGDGDVDRAPAKRVRDPVRPQLFAQQLDAGALLLEGLPERRQRPEACAPVVADAQRAELAACRSSGCVDCGVRLRDRTPRTSKERAAGFGQPDLARAAHEEIRADLLLEPTNRGAERRLRHVETARGTAEVQLLGDRDEVAEMAELGHESSVLPAIPNRYGARPIRCFARPAVAASVAGEERSAMAELPTIHRFPRTSNGAFVNAYLVETDSSLVAIDSLLTVSESRAFRAEIDNFGKPLRAVLLTHSHPDHYGGLT